ncbi:glycosyltransferase family 4 protein [Ornithinimicrobium sp. W1665]|uniref:glycosyltransferase family 4 protein n=1 Tax=Ornithinimicrobium sp. W1665 TaxID=3416666 RepID=UPI003CF99823
MLLISPVAALDPPSGDVTYTEQLVRTPPPGVAYTTYDEAIAQGDLTELGTRESLRAASGPDLVLQAGVALARKLERLVRRSGLAYREPIRIFRVNPQRFDLVHVHVFHHRFLGAHPPVVASAGGPLRWVYADAWGWGRTRVAMAEGIDHALGWLWGATMCAARLGRADLFISPSEYLRTWLQERGWPSARIAVQPNYLSLGRASEARDEAPRTIGFVARDFAAKGGMIVLEAFAALRQRHPTLRLIIVGSPARLSESEQHRTGIRWFSQVARSQLLEEILPSIDLLAYPSGFDTGVPYSAMEAISQGIPAVVSDYRSLPDLVGDGAGLVSRPDAASVSTAIEKLLAPATYATASAAAAQRFHQKFSAVTQAPRLRKLYEAALVGVSASAIPPRKRPFMRRKGTSTHR